MNDDREILRRRREGPSHGPAADGPSGAPARLGAARAAADEAESALAQMHRVIGGFAATDLVNSGGQ